MGRNAKIKAMRKKMRDHREAGNSPSQAAIGVYMYETPARFRARRRTIVRGVEGIRLLELRRRPRGHADAGRLHVIGLVTAAADSDAARRAFPLPPAIAGAFGCDFGFVHNEGKAEEPEPEVPADELPTIDEMPRLGGDDNQEPAAPVGGEG